MEQRAVEARDGAVAAAVVLAARPPLAVVLITFIALVVPVVEAAPVPPQDGAVARADAPAQHVAQHVAHVLDLGQFGRAAPAVQQRGARAQGVRAHAGAALVGGGVEGAAVEPEPVDGAAQAAGLGGVQGAALLEVPAPAVQRVQVRPAAGHGADGLQLPEQGERVRHRPGQVRRLRGVVRDELHRVAQGAEVALGGGEEDGELLRGRERGVQAPVGGGEGEDGGDVRGVPVDVEEELGGEVIEAHGWAVRGLSSVRHWALLVPSLAFDSLAGSYYFCHVAFSSRLSFLFGLQSVSSVLPSATLSPNAGNAGSKARSRFGELRVDRTRPSDSENAHVKERSPLPWGYSEKQELAERHRDNALQPEDPWRMQSPCKGDPPGAP